MTLKEFIDELLLEFQEIDSIFRNKKRYIILKHARRGLHELNMSFATHVQAMSIEVPLGCRIYKPDNFSSFVRAYLIDCNGNTLEIKKNNKIPDVIFGILTDCDGTILSDEEGYLMTCPADCNNENLSPHEDSSLECIDNLSKTNAVKYLLTKYKNSWIKVKDNLPYIEFSPDLEGKTIVVEFLSGSAFEDSECNIYVDDDVREALEYYIKFKILENGVDTLRQSQYYKQQFKMKRNRMNIKSNQLSKIELQLFLSK